jgi:hypothetical protein
VIPLIVSPLSSVSRRPIWAGTRSDNLLVGPGTPRGRNADSNLRQDSMTITEFCRRLETMAASLAEFGDPIGDRQMVLTLLRGLSGKFRHMVSILKMHHPFPTFIEAQTHLLLEEMEIDARLPSPPVALVVHQQ